KGCRGARGRTGGPGAGASTALPRIRVHLSSQSWAKGSSRGEAVLKSFTYFQGRGGERMTFGPTRWAVVGIEGWVSWSTFLRPSGSRLMLAWRSIRPSRVGSLRRERLVEPVLYWVL